MELLLDRGRRELQLAVLVDEHGLLAVMPWGVLPVPGEPPALDLLRHLALRRAWCRSAVLVRGRGGGAGHSKPARGDPVVELQALQVEARGVPARLVQSKPAPCLLMDCPFEWLRRLGSSTLVQSMDDHHSRGRVIQPKSPAQTSTGSTPSLVDTVAAASLVIWTFS